MIKNMTYWDLQNAQGKIEWNEGERKPTKVYAAALRDDQKRFTITDAELLGQAQLIWKKGGTESEYKEVFLEIGKKSTGYGEEEYERIKADALAAGLYPVWD